MADYNRDEQIREEKRLKMAKEAAKPFRDQYDPQMRYMENEMVDSPPHYAASDIECIDAMRASMSKESFSGYCKGNVMKYLWRFEKKGEGTQDLEKAKVYLNWLIDNETILYGTNKQKGSVTQVIKPIRIPKQ